MSMLLPVFIRMRPPICQSLLVLCGCRTSWVRLGISTLVLCLPLILLLSHSKPELLCLKPDGVNRYSSTASLSGKEPEIWGLTRGEALRTPTFYIIAAGLTALSMLVTTLPVFFKGILTSHGLEPQTATLMFTVTGITAAVSMPIVGQMLDKFRTDWMFCGGLLVMVASLVSVTFVSVLLSAVVFAIIFGINNGGTMTFFGFLLLRSFVRWPLGNTISTAA